MTTFDETKHPRGHHTHPGRFSEKPHTDPEATLQKPVAPAAVDLDTWEPGENADEDALIRAELAAYRAASSARRQDPVGQHLESVCHEAGLEGVMGAVFDVIRDREELDDDDLFAVTAGDVTDLYDSYVGPAIDRAQNQLA